jgi:hypothetical protein
MPITSTNGFAEYEFQLDQVNVYSGSGSPFASGIGVNAC